MYQPQSGLIRLNHRRGATNEVSAFCARPYHCGGCFCHCGQSPKLSVVFDGGLGDEVVNCGFECLEQCRASLSGGGDRCIENNTYKPPAPQSVSGENTAAPAQVSGAKKVQPPLLA